MMISKEHMDKINEWKKDGLVIGFMDNNFDGLDLNHLKMLKHASDNSDKLIVGLYTDYIIKMNGSIDEPKHIYEYRRDILNALDYVDMIVCIDEMTPKCVIKEIKPHKVFIHRYNEHKMEDVEMVSKLNDIEIINMDNLIVNSEYDEHKQKAIVVDIDNTIYHEHKQIPIYDILLIINVLKRMGYSIIVSTYRCEDRREETENWLHKYINYDLLYMRPASEKVSSYKWKEHVYKNHIMKNYDVEYVFENDKDDYNMYIDHGLTSLLVSVD